ncbi:MAG: DUF1329 domain-containing protein [Sulfuricaulis sp.]|uniref:DUF1329 domain-containing protein n=1 Tax=Sulfuricaulis sp. TaxID=2003553 RepID=UPI0025CCF0A8|nr:DUF1329 domain-containing protein [Sulfuricaulis sp.]MCR4347841.1 DUF1329 domain-containing protein [Sulfuricaulis sp.]
MTQTKLSVILATATLLCFSTVSTAELGRDLTPLGAQAAANSAGTIPAWNGGLTTPVTGFKPGGHYPDPYADDKPKLTIDAANADQHKDRLSAGQIALLKKYPTWKMNVYPTQRSAVYPKAVYEATAANIGTAKLAAGGNGVTGTTAGIPFPVPKDGLETIWNVLLRYKGDTYAMTWNQAAVTRDGAYTLVRFEYEYDFSYSNVSKPAAEREPNKLTNFLQIVTAPARLAGQVLLVHETVDQVKQPRSAWIYNPGQRRVRLAPNVAYDNPGTAADGLRTSDDFGMYNGATDRYDWKLVGKQEMYIPYNSYKLGSNTLKYADILKPGHINPEHTRYELHRVWVVEATLKPGASHIYKRRTFYIDEDSWAIVVTDKYDARDQLWRVSEQHSMNFYDVPMYYGTVEVHSDLQSGRYIAMGLRNEESKVYQPIRRSAADFTPANLRNLGTR